MIEQHWKWGVLGVALMVALSGCTGEDAAGVGAVGPSQERDAGDNQNPDVPAPEPDTAPEPDAPPPDIACLRDEDCTEDDDVCVVEQGEALSTLCDDAVGAGEPGDPCEENADCQNNLCLEGICADLCATDDDCEDPLRCLEVPLEGGSVQICAPLLCERPADCDDPDVCQLIEADGELGFICDGADDDLGDLSDTCTEDADCQSQFCEQNRCSAPCTEDGDCVAEIPLDCTTITRGDTDLSACIGPPVCARDADCPDGEVCRFVRGDEALHAFCGPPDDDPGLPPGAACENDEDCARGLCHAGLCAQACGEDVDCDGELVCQQRVVEVGEGNVEAQLCGVLPEDACGRDSDCQDPDGCVARRRPDRVDFVCGDINEGGARQGEPCQGDEGCARNLCADGVCVEACRLGADCPEGLICDNISVEVELGEAEAQVCAAPQICEAPAQCGDGETCFIRPVGDEDVETVCLPPNPGGRPLAAPCEEDSQCEANLCLSDLGRTTCAHPCGQDADCDAPGYRCVPRELRGSPVSQRNVCAPPEPTPCLRNADCEGGQRCAVVPNRADTALVSVCLDTPGDGLPGAPCTEDAECDADLCVDGFCSALCQNRADCASEQICEPQTVVRDDLSGIFEACRTLPDVQCIRNAECSDGNRVCGLIDFTSPASIQCTFPVEDGAPVGSACDGSISPSNQCFDGICLSSLTGECTQACGDDTDCQGIPGGYVCSEFGFPGARLNMCADGCTRDPDCGRDDHLCGLARNVNADRFEFICRLPTGDDPPGSDCSDQVRCDHGICLIRGETRTCTLPCETDVDCPPEMPTCGDATIGRPASDESQTLRVCTPP